MISIIRSRKKILLSWPRTVERFGWRATAAGQHALPFSSSSSHPRTRRTRLSASRRRSPKAPDSLCQAPSALDIPSMSMAQAMPVSYRGIDNTSLLALGLAQPANHKALEEMLKRHIMATDGVGYHEACPIFTQIEKKNYEYEILMALPFQTGIVLCFLGGAISIPLVFHLSTVEFFNDHFVTAEHPPTKELETALEVGSWSWNWMEPVLGTSTFLLLCLQYLRMNLQHLGVNPYTLRMKRMRGRHLADAFPQYNEELLLAYSEATPFYNEKDLWW